MLQYLAISYMIVLNLDIEQVRMFSKISVGSQFLQKTYNNTLHIECTPHLKVSKGFKFHQIYPQGLLCITIKISQWD